MYLEQAKSQIKNGSLNGGIGLGNFAYMTSVCLKISKKSFGVPHQKHNPLCLFEQRGSAPLQGKRCTDLVGRF